MRKLKILQVVTSTIGGAGMHVYYLSRYLDRQQFETAVAFTPGQHLDYLFYDAAIPVLPLHMGRNVNLRGMWHDGRMLYRYCREEAIDIVHTHNTLAGLIGRLAARAAGVPVVIHMLHTFAAHPYTPFPQKQIYQSIDRLWRPLTTCYIAGSHYIRDKAVRQKIAPPDAIQTIHNAVDETAFRDVPVTPAHRLTRRQALDLPADSLVIGFIGRLEAQKAPQVLLDALAQVVCQVPNVHLLLVGDGPLRPSLHSQSARLQLQDQVHFLGWRADIPELLSIMDIFCLPSWWEAFGIVFAEASLMGVPIVATRVEGIPEVVLDGQTGLLVPPGQPEPIAQALLTLLQDPNQRQQMGENGRLHAQTHFTLPPMIHAHQALYLRLMTQPH